LAVALLQWITVFPSRSSFRRVAPDSIWLAVWITTVVVVAKALVRVLTFSASVMLGRLHRPLLASFAGSCLGLYAAVPSFKQARSSLGGMGALANVQLLEQRFHLVQQSLVARNMSLALLEKCRADS